MCHNIIHWRSVTMESVQHSNTSHGNMSTIQDLKSSLTLEDLNHEEVQRRLPPMIYIGVLMIIGIPGNISVILIYLKNFGSTTHKTFIVALAVIDTIACTVCMPFEIIEMNFQYTFYAVGACKFFRFNNTFIALSSIFTIVGMSVDRYRRVCHPLRTQMTVFVAKIVCGIACVVAVTFSWPIFFLLGTRHVQLSNNITGYDCSTSDKYRKTNYPFIHNAILLLVFIITIIALIIIYGLIGRKIFKHIKYRKNFKSSSSSSSSSKTTSSTKVTQANAETNMKDFKNNPIEKSERPHISESQKERNSKIKITKIAFAINLAFIFSYMPHLVITIWTAIKGGFIAPPGSISSAILPIVTRSIFLNNVANPIIYGFLDVRFRKCLQDCICRLTSR